MALCAAFAAGCTEEVSNPPQGTPWTIKMTVQIEEARTIRFTLDKENPVTIDWGDGSEVNYLNWHHDYQPGTYRLTLSGQGSIGLGCARCGLTSLDVSQCPVLTSLSCGDNSLASLDLSACPELTYLACSLNQMERLNVENCSSLDTLIVSFNQLAQLDISHNPKLKLLKCELSGLTALDISHCPELAELYITYNKFTPEALQSIIDALPDRSGRVTGLLFVEDNEADLSGLAAKNWTLGR